MKYFVLGQLWTLEVDQLYEDCSGTRWRVTYAPTGLGSELAVVQRDDTGEAFEDSPEHFLIGVEIGYYSYVGRAGGVMARYTVGDTTGDRILMHLGRYRGLSAIMVAEDLSISPSSARGWLHGLLAQGKVARSGWPYKWTVVRTPAQVAIRLPNGVYRSGDGTRWVLVGYGGDPGHEYAVLHQLVDYAEGQVVAQYPFLEDFREGVRKGAWVFVGPRP